MNQVDTTIQSLNDVAHGVTSIFSVQEYYFGPLGRIPMMPIQFFGLVVTLLLIALVMYLKYETEEVAEKGKSAYKDHFVRSKSTDSVSDTRWGRVTELLSSVNPNDWRLAIIEADNMLDQMLITLGYPGASVGERLTAVPPAQFPTLDLAWQAHKIRNRIAHEGMDYQLDYRDAVHAYRCYEKVFLDAHYIEL